MNKRKNRENVRAFAPGNISCFFALAPHKNPRWRGSLGLGFTVNEGVIATVSIAEKTDIFFNEKHIIFPTVTRVIHQLTVTPIRVELHSRLPIGSGFGISGASALATAYAVNELLKKGKTKKQLAIIAHTADAAEKTGLGDVVNQYFGGMLLKLLPSSRFRVKRLPLAGTKLYYKVFSGLSTKSVLSDESLLNKIDTLANREFDQIHRMGIEALSFDDILDLSYDFVKDSGLLKDASTKKLIESLRSSGHHASMIVIGNAVMSTIQFVGSTELSISDTPAHLL